MTKLNTATLSAAALLAVLASPAMAAESASSNLTATLGTVGIGNPHQLHHAAAVDTRQDQRRRVEIAEWEKLFGRHPFPAMGLGTHTVAE